VKVHIVGTATDEPTRRDRVTCVQPQGWNWSADSELFGLEPRSDSADTSVLTQTLRSVLGIKSAMVGAWLKASYPSS
jgi:hypothetical protein